MFAGGIVPSTSSGRRYRTRREGSTKNEGGATTEDRLETPMPGLPTAPTPTITSRRDASLPPRLHHTAAPTPQCSPPNRASRRHRSIATGVPIPGWQPTPRGNLYATGTNGRRRSPGRGRPHWTMATLVDARRRAGISWVESNGSCSEASPGVNGRSAAVAYWPRSMEVVALTESSKTVGFRINWMLPSWSARTSTSTTSAANWVPAFCCI